MTTLSEAFDHLVYWWDRLLCRALPTFGVMLGEPTAEFSPPHVLPLPPPTTDPLGGVSFADACTGIKRAQRLGYLARPLPQEFELADNEAFLDPISGRSWIWTSGEFVRTPDADVPPAGER